MHTGQFARLIRKSHKNTKSILITASEFNERYGAKKHNSWYYRIAYDGYDPASLRDRKRFGLGPRPCKTCTRKITVPGVLRIPARTHRQELPPINAPMWNRFSQELIK